MLERLTRQAWQTALPIICTISQDGTPQPEALILTLATVEVVTLGAILLRELTQITVPPGAPLIEVITDRALSAFAGVVLGFWPSTWTGLTAAPWTHVLTAAAASAVIAVASWWMSPPLGPTLRQIDLNNERRGS